MDCQDLLKTERVRTEILNVTDRKRPAQDSVPVKDEGYNNGRKKQPVQDLRVVSSNHSSSSGRIKACHLLDFLGPPTQEQQLRKCSAGRAGKIVLKMWRRNRTQHRSFYSCARSAIGAVCCSLHRRASHQCWVLGDLNPLGLCPRRTGLTARPCSLQTPRRVHITLNLQTFPCPRRRHRFSCPVAPAAAAFPPAAQKHRPPRTPHRCRCWLSGRCPLQRPLQHPCGRLHLQRA